MPCPPLLPPPPPLLDRLTDHEKSPFQTELKRRKYVTRYPRYIERWLNDIAVLGCNWAIRGRQTIVLQLPTWGIEWPMLWRITINSLHNAGTYK